MMHQPLVLDLFLQMLAQLGQDTLIRVLSPNPYQLIVTTPD